MRIYADQRFALHVNHLGYVESPERFEAAMEGVDRAESTGVPVTRVTPEPAPRALLEAVHTPRYLDRLHSISMSGGGYLDVDTALSPGSWDAAVLASGAAMGAVESALSGTAAFALTRPPGHHAGQSRAMGFCLLNHVAVAAVYALESGAARVAIVDWDVHHGNGTQDIFYSDDRVLYLSVHRENFYPGTGAGSETGEGEGEGFTVNVPLPGGSGEERYVAAFAGVFVPILKEFRPDVLLISAGYDAHMHDPLGGMGLSEGSFGAFAAGLRALTSDLQIPPPALVLEGGYDLSALTASVAATIVGAESGKQPQWAYSGVVQPVESTREILAPFWSSLR